jgi:surface antigen
MPSDPPSHMLRVDSTEVTGSIRKGGSEFGRGLDAEDLRRARAALGTALDPQSAGGGVKWENADTGAKGVFTPVGQAYPQDGKICRAFLAEIATTAGDEHLQGTACREKVAEWTILETKPWRKG